MRGAMPTISSDGPNYNGGDRDGWVASAIRKPVISRAIHPSTLPAFLRSNSQPAHTSEHAQGMDSQAQQSRGTRVGSLFERGRRSTADGYHQWQETYRPRQQQRQQATRITSTVIEMEGAEEADSTRQRQSRRRLSAANSTPSEGSSGRADGLALNQLVPELSHLASSLLRGATNAASSGSNGGAHESPSSTAAGGSATTSRGGANNSHYQAPNFSPLVTISISRNGVTRQRSVRYHNSATQTHSGGPDEGEEEEEEEHSAAGQGDEGNVEGNEGDAGADEAAHTSGDFPHLQSLLRNRGALMRNLWQNLFEFPHLHGMGVLLTFLVVVTTLGINFLFHHFSACLALVLAFFHYQDAARFQRSLAGTGDVYIAAGNVLMRNFIVLYVLNKSFVLEMASFHEQITIDEQSLGFFPILYRVVVTELFIMDVALLCKILVAKFPALSKTHKRRIFQWVEYSCILYRFPVPFMQWVFYLEPWWDLPYMLLKLFIGLSILWTWLRTTVRLFFYVHLGSVPSEEEAKKAENCTICFGDFTSPLKLTCGHIYCSECIRTWLDREVTCPVCRAVVTKEDNHYRRGNTTFPMHMF